MEDFPGSTRVLLLSSVNRLREGPPEVIDGAKSRSEGTEVAMLVFDFWLFLHPGFAEAGVQKVEAAGSPVTLTCGTSDTSFARSCFSFPPEEKIVDILSRLRSKCDARYSRLRFDT